MTFLLYLLYTRSGIYIIHNIKKNKGKEGEGLHAKGTKGPSRCLLVIINKVPVGKFKILNKQQRLDMCIYIYIYIHAISG